MKKEYTKPLAEMIKFIPENDIMTDDGDDVDEPSLSQGVEEW